MVGVARGHQRADTLKPYSQKTSQSNHTRTTALSNSRKPSHTCGATQDGRVMVERSNRTWSTGEGNGKPLHYSCLDNLMNSMNSMKSLPRCLKTKFVLHVYELCVDWIVPYIIFSFHLFLRFIQNIACSSILLSLLESILYYEYSTLYWSFNYWRFDHFYLVLLSVLLVWMFYFKYFDECI